MIEILQESFGPLATTAAIWYLAWRAEPWENAHPPPPCDTAVLALRRATKGSQQCLLNQIRCRRVSRIPWRQNESCTSSMNGGDYYMAPTGVTYAISCGRRGTSGIAIDRR